MPFTILAWIKSHAILSAISAIVAIGLIGTIASSKPQVPVQQSTPLIKGAIDSRLPRNHSDQQSAQVIGDENIVVDADEKELENSQSINSQTSQHTPENVQSAPASLPTIENEAHSEQSITQELETSPIVLVPESESDQVDSVPVPALQNPYNFEIPLASCNDDCSASQDYNFEIEPVIIVPDITNTNPPNYNFCMIADRLATCPTE